MSVLRDFGAAVRALRDEAGLSQEDLAHRAGLDRTYVSGVERGVRNPTLKVIDRLAQALGTDATGLFQRIRRSDSSEGAG